MLCDQSRRRPWVSLGLALALGALLACKKKPPPPPVPRPAASALARCASGRSVDPPHAELNEAVAVMKAKEYQKAQQVLDQLMKKYTDSATVRVWRGDAALFDDKKSELAGADEALPFYDEAEKLHDLGCKLAEMDHYVFALRLCSCSAQKRPGKACATPSRSDETAMARQRGCFLQQCARVLPRWRRRQVRG